MGEEIKHQGKKAIEHRAGNELASLQSGVMAGKKKKRSVGPRKSSHQKSRREEEGSDITPKAVRV